MCLREISLGELIFMESLAGSQHSVRQCELGRTRITGNIDKAITGKYSGRIYLRGNLRFPEEIFGKLIWSSFWRGGGMLFLHLSGEARGPGSRGGPASWCSHAQLAHSPTKQRAGTPRASPFPFPMQLGRARLEGGYGPGSWCSSACKGARSMGGPLAFSQSPLRLKRSYFKIRSYFLDPILFSRLQRSAKLRSDLKIKSGS